MALDVQLIFFQLVRDYQGNLILRKLNLLLYQRIFYVSELDLLKLVASKDLFEGSAL